MSRYFFSWFFAGRLRYQASCLSVFVLMATWASPAAGGPFDTLPGVRAMALSSAVTAMPDDPAAVWHNPAGIALRRNDVIIGWIQGPAADSSDASVKADENVLVGGGVFDYKRLFRFGGYYLEPYNLRFRVNDTGADEWAWGGIRETIQVFSFPAAVSVWEDRLQIGVTGEWVRLYTGESTPYIRQYGFPAPYDPAETTESGYSGSVGMLIGNRAAETGAMVWKFGAVYRLPSVTDAAGAFQVQETDTAAGALFYDKPGSWDVGLSASRKISPLETLQAGIRYGMTDWGAAVSPSSSLKCADIGIGIEYTGRLNGPFLKTGFIRAGYGISTVSGQTDAAPWPDMKRFTFGVGCMFGDLSKDTDRLTVNLSGESRTLEPEDGSGSSVFLLGLDLIWSFW